MLETRDFVLRFDPRNRHRETKLVATDPIEIITPAPQWSYGAWISGGTPADRTVPASALIVKARIEVRAGHVGVGWTRLDQDEFVVEKYVSGPGIQTVSLRVPIDTAPGRLMFRNASPSGPSHLIVHEWAAAPDRPRPYPVTIDHREMPAGAAADTGIVFEDELARSINGARLDFLASLDLPLRGKRVLDVGCGVGHHTAFYTAAGADVVGLDGRPENIAAMARLYPGVMGVVGDVQSTDLTQFGAFDVVHCFGLLYHLDSPVAALRRLAAVCREHLIIETMVADGAAPVMVLADESGSANQALAGLGCRPTPSFIAMALDRIGFAHIYGTTAPPRHPDFLFEWRDSLNISRDGHNLRCVFVASRVALSCAHLVELVPGD